MSFTHELVLGRKLGQGYFGDVHEGQDPIHGKVAVKVLRKIQNESDPQWHARREELLSEAKKLKAAEHPNVVGIHALIRSNIDDRLHMVVEFCDKGSLQTNYETGPMSLSTAKAILNDICRGLDCIHARGMIHRDIKPGNILGAGKRFKIADFGLVSDNLVAGYASAVGYTDHLAPEVHTEHITSPQTDIWALGMTVYRLLHGHQFYSEQMENVDIVESIVNGGFASRLNWLPHVPMGWRKFIRKAMHDDTSLRFKTAFAVAQYLALLPTEPAWECQYTSSKVIWTRQKADRQIEVILNKTIPKKQSWHALSKGGARDRSMGGCTSPIPKRQAQTELEEFFSQTS